MNIQCPALPYPKQRLTVRPGKFTRFPYRLIMALAFCSLMVAAAAFAVQTGNHNRYISPNEMFVYPDGDNTILVLPEGAYVVQGTSLAPGCYHLTDPQNGETWGKAEPAGFCLP